MARKKPKTLQVDDVVHFRGDMDDVPPSRIRGRYRLTKADKLTKRQLPHAKRILRLVRKAEQQGISAEAVAAALGVPVQLIKEVWGWR